jgi:phosphate acetyltransferase
MPILTTLHDRARAANKRIVFPEGEDQRTVEAAASLLEHKLARPILIGRPSVIEKHAHELGVNLAPHATIIDPLRSELTDGFARELYQLRKHRGLTYEEAKVLSTNVLYFGALMVQSGRADGSVAGAAHPTPDVIRAALHVLGTADGTRLVSSFFMMNLPDGRAVTFADCGLNVDPSDEELAAIGTDAARSHAALTGEEPVVAFLSFSTKGSARHERSDKVIRAVEMAKLLAPDLAIDGEFQFDTAFVPSLGAQKAPGSSVAGHANVFVFPDLDSGNIGYKIAQRIGGAEAYGPILQGLKRPANDLSRGAVATDIVNVAVITAVQAQQIATA